jgi:formylglycine-generating enzyme required for sulfatase activity
MGEGSCRGSLACVSGVCAEPAAIAVSDNIPEGFVRIEAGTFTMGSPGGELGRRDNETQHEVTLTRAFLMQTTEVTHANYEALMGSNPSYFSSCGGACPVERVTWFNAVAYANALSRAEGFPECYDAQGEVIGGETVYDCTGYRLPTEAEWEYAARAGTTTATYAGDLTREECEDGTLLPIAWFCGSESSQTNPVGGRLPNAWGLYDMLGNVLEWTSDWYDDYPGTTTDPTGPSYGSDRVLRGGAWVAQPRSTRAAVRFDVNPRGRNHNTGFRVARTLS